MVVLPLPEGPTRAMERPVVIGDFPFYIGQGDGVGGILDIRFGFDHRRIALEAGKPLLDHFRQFHQNLDGADENADVEGVHGQIRRLHLSLRDKIAAKDQGYQVHHALEKQVPAHERTHTLIVGVLGKKEPLVALIKFPPFHILVGKGLDHTDPCQGILQGGVYVPDLFAVIHESGLHPLVLA